MKKIFLLGMLSIISLATGIAQTNNMKEKILRHVVLFSFKEGSSDADIKAVTDAFNALPHKIPQIKKYEWGTNNSPENLNQGFTHCFLLTFVSEADRAIYLPHPDHVAFGNILKPVLDKVLVIDYWASE